MNFSSTDGCATRSCILTLIGAYVPGCKAGGPIRSVKNLVAALGREFDFRILTLDRDLGDRHPFPGIVVDLPLKIGDASVTYMRPGLRGLLRTWSLLRSVDRQTVVYVNSFFNRRFSMLPVIMRRLQLCRPQCLVIAPRGEFSPGAMRFKPLRKLLYVRMTQWLGLYNDLIWQASSRFEAADIQYYFPQATDIDVAAVVPDPASPPRKKGRSEVVAASDISPATMPGLRDARKKTPGRLSIAFVSRVARKKNLADALKLVSKLSGEVSFDIYGPAEDNVYWQECQSIIATFPPNIRARYWGTIDHDQVWQVFAGHDLFFFPTFGENYGHVISEALAAGCPALISDQTPWRNLEEKGVGWDIPLSQPDRFHAVLQQCVDADEAWYSAVSARAMRFAAERASDPGIIDANRKLFLRAFAWHN